MKPPFEITAPILEELRLIERLLGRVEGLEGVKPQPHLRKQNKVKTIQGSLAIEGNTLALNQVTALLEGRRVLGPAEEIKEVMNAITAYEDLRAYNPHKLGDLLKAHGILMKGLVKGAGRWRGGNVGIVKGKEVSHVAPPAELVAGLMKDLLTYLKKGEAPALVKACVFHYELEFIHPFEDGNGRIGRFWHSLLLCQYHPVFEWIPVESLIKDHQADYYRALERSDKSGQSTPFIEFSLNTIRRALEHFLSDIHPKPLTAKERLEKAHAHFATQQFSRKDYLQLHKKISTATASRDLKRGVESTQLSMTGDKSKALYSFTEDSL